MNHPKKPIIAATGLICLDIIPMKEHPEPALFAAGSCVNVTAVMSTFGWDIYVAGRIGDDSAARLIRNDLDRLNISDDTLFSDDSLTTPRYFLNAQPESHGYLKHCPQCNAPFPSFAPMTSANLSTVQERWPDKVDVYYFDKVTEPAVTLAENYRNKGALIYFEPNHIDNPKLFEKSLSLSHVVKYSHDRAKNLQPLTEKTHAPLEIETLGRDGLRYRITHNGKRSEWFHCPALLVDPLVDAAGAGDWFSATLLNHIGRLDLDPDWLHQKKLEHVFNEAQKQSAKNCTFHGARGAMYHDLPYDTGTDYCPSC